MTDQKTAIAEMLDALERAPSIIVPLVRETPEANRKRKPANGKWSVHEHAVHLAIVHPIFEERLQRMLRENDPVIKPYEPGLDDEDGALLKMDLDESLDRFTRDRAALVQRLRALTPEQWQRSALHPEYSPYTVANMFRHVALHDFLHGYRIEELALKPSW